jgi:putative ABC transport system ATP-binding protein
MINTPTLVHVDNVIKDFQGPAGVIHVLKSVNLSVAAGEFVGVRGPSGSGKSTLINMITGIDRPTGGRVQVAGQHIERMSENALARFRGKNIGVIFQFFQLLPTLTVAENVMLPMDFAGVIPRSRRRERALDLLDQVGIADQADKLPATLSGGQQQRAAVARALANDPPLIVADEPTGNLDSASAQTVIGLLAGLAGTGRTVLVATHDTELAACADRIVRLADGRIEHAQPVVVPA